MPYACVQDVASNWEQDQQFAGTLAEPAPTGVILRVAGPTDEGLRIIDIWKSGTPGSNSGAERLAPAIAVFGGPSRPEPRFRDLQAWKIKRKRAELNSPQQVKVAWRVTALRDGGREQESAS